MKPRLCVLLFVGCLALGAASMAAQLESRPGEWPGWRGPDRNGLSKETGLLRNWPAGGPKLLWRTTGLGDGYGTVAIAGDKLFVMGSKGRTEILVARNLADGSPLWTAEIGAEAGGYPGPRSTPTVDGTNVYCLSSDGKLACVEIAAGKVTWKRDLKRDFAGQTGNWAYAESPLIDGDRLVCTPGGDRATIVCLDKRTGKEIWEGAVTGLKLKERTGKFGSKGKGGKGGRPKATYGQAGYSSAIVAEVGGVKQYIQFLTGGVVGVSADKGKLLWHYDHPSSGMTNCSTPIFADGSVFAASGYGTGGGCAKIVATDGTFKAEEKYFVSNFQNHHGGVVLVGDYLYGTNNTGLMCVNFKTGEVAWTARGVGKGSVAYADGHIYHRGERGDVALVEADPAAYKEKGRFSQPGRSDKNAWAYPVIAGGKLYLRDWDSLLCYDIKAAN